MMLQKKAKFFFIFCLFYIVFQNVFAKETIYTLPEDGDKPILEAINKAQSSIQLVMYSFTHKEIAQALIQAKKRGVKEYILIEKKPYKTESLNDENLRRLYRAGIDVHFTPSYFRLLHQKSIIVDDNEAYILTNNFTYSGFNKQRNFIYLTDNKKMIKEMKEVFFADYYQKPLRILSSQLIWSPDNSKDCLVHLIAQARWSIDAYIASINNLDIIRALQAASKRGVRVRMILLKQEKDTHRRLMKAFARAGIMIKEVRNIHAKTFIIDIEHPSQKAYLGSQNLTSASLYKNRELGTIILAPEWIIYLEQVFSKDFYSKRTEKLQKNWRYDIAA